MQSFNLKPRAFGFLVGTRAALAFGIGLLVASRIAEAPRKRIGLALLGLGAATTVPAIHLLRRSRTPARVNGAHAAFNGAHAAFNGTHAEFSGRRAEYDGTHTEFGFARPM